MLESLLSMLKAEAGMMNATVIIANIANLVKMVEPNILKEGVTKNAIIDSLVQILQAHKDPTVT